MAKDDNFSLEKKGEGILRRDAYTRTQQMASAKIPHAEAVRKHPPNWLSFGSVIKVILKNGEEIVRQHLSNMREVKFYSLSIATIDDRIILEAVVASNRLARVGLVDNTAVIGEDFDLIVLKISKGNVIARRKCMRFVARTPATPSSI